MTNQIDKLFLSEDEIEKDAIKAASNHKHIELDEVEKFIKDVKSINK